MQIISSYQHYNAHCDHCGMQLQLQLQPLQQLLLLLLLLLLHTLRSLRKAGGFWVVAASVCVVADDEDEPWAWVVWWFCCLSPMSHGNSSSVSCRVIAAAAGATSAAGPQTDKQFNSEMGLRPAFSRASPKNGQSQWTSWPKKWPSMSAPNGPTTSS